MTVTIGEQRKQVLQPKDEGERVQEKHIAWLDGLAAYLALQPPSLVLWSTP